MRPDRDVRVFVKARVQVELPIGTSRTEGEAIARARLALAKAMAGSMAASTLVDAHRAWGLAWALLDAAKIEG